MLIEFAPGVGSAQIGEITDKVGELTARVPSVVSAVCGRDAGVTAGSSDFAIVVDLADPADYRAYSTHPAHDELVAVLGPCVRSRSVVDFIV
ncbi:hypothetical protein BJF78_06750 [Pseudonocardia sp. CNS-139]|nr:hypothetical protein BJF78_06750 [Pseudonocardia sp. CNS-139]